MISARFTFPVSDCSILFLADFGFIWMLECGHQILFMFVESKIIFMHFFCLILVWLFWICLWTTWAFLYYMNDLNMYSSLNLIIKNHTLASFGFHLHWPMDVTWNEALYVHDLLDFPWAISSVLALLLSSFVHSHVSGKSGVWGSHLGWPSCLGVILRKFHEGHFSYGWEFWVWVTTLLVVPHLHRQS